jgi:hypothetical protein
MPLSWLNAIRTVLNDFPDGLHYTEIASIIYERGYRDANVPTSVNVYLNNNEHIFERFDTGYYRLIMPFARPKPLFQIDRNFLNRLSKIIGNIEFLDLDNFYSESNIHIYNSQSEHNPSVSLIGIITPGQSDWLYEALYFASSQNDISNLIFIYSDIDDVDDIIHIVSWLNGESTRLKYFLVEKQENNSLNLTIAPDGWNLDSYLKSFRDQLKQALVKQIPDLREQDFELVSDKVYKLKISNIHYVCSVESERLVALSCLLEGDYRNQYSRFINTSMYRLAFEDRELKTDFDETDNKSIFTINIPCDIRDEFRTKELIKEIFSLLTLRFKAALEYLDV